MTESENCDLPAKPFGRLRDWLKTLSASPTAKHDILPLFSIIVCSIDRNRFEQVSANFYRLFGDEKIEIIGIHDARSLAEGYNRGIDQAHGDLLIFSHDDVEILTPDFARRIRAHLQDFDLIGVAGTTWLTGGACYPWEYCLVTSPLPESGKLIAFVHGGGDLIVPGIQALDGLFLAMRTEVAEAVRFDEQTFDHFHLYDLDFTFRAYLAGYRLAVCRDLFIVHHSHGRFDETWQKYSRRFEAKFADKLMPRPVERQQIRLSVPVESPELDSPEGVTLWTSREKIASLISEIEWKAANMEFESTEITAKNKERQRKDKISLVLTMTGANDSILGLLEDYTNALRECGLSVLQLPIPADTAELQYVIDLMKDGEIGFTLTWLGVGQDLAIRRADDSPPMNAFEAFQVPLVKLQGDLPAYFVERHRDTPRNAANLYQADEFVHFRRRWIPEAQAVTSLIPPMPMVPMDRGELDLSNRKNGKLVFVKNGNSPDGLKELWRERLPESIEKLLSAMAEAILPVGLRPGRVDIGDFVSDFLTGHSIETVPAANLVIFCAAQMDDYLRRVKSTIIAEAILDFPVIVQGSFWDHVDFSGKRARHAVGEDVVSSQRIVLEELGVIDMSANVDTWPHDRVQRAAGSYALVLTNRQGWFENNFPQFSDLTFEFTADSIRSRVADVLANRQRYLDEAVAFGEQYQAMFPRRAFAERVIAMADLAALSFANPKPHLQPFFVWPDR